MDWSNDGYNNKRKSVLELLKVMSRGREGARGWVQEANPSKSVVVHSQSDSQTDPASLASPLFESELVLSVKCLHVCFKSYTTYRCLLSLHHSFKSN